MKNVFYSILLFACVCFGFAACSSGAYSASPDSNANGVINPLTPLTSSQFTWAGGAAGSMGATINGVPWVAGAVSWSLDTVGGNKLIGVLGSQIMYLYLRNTYAVNVYSMGYKDYNTSGTWADSVNTYYSVLGNSGEVKITSNDSLSITGLFYFEGLTSSGQIVAINNGYFNIAK